MQYVNFFDNIKNATVWITITVIRERLLWQGNIVSTNSSENAWIYINEKRMCESGNLRINMPKDI